eukprot:m.245302 g.245302  ORF g.245302 m.245302 type:complete len:390 (+) comp26400_c0_seq4:1912-3081(+)
MSQSGVDAIAGADVAALTTPAAIGVVGAAGLYGRWLMDLFGGLYPEAEVIGIDADGDSTAKTEFVAKCDVVVFSVPIPITPAVIREYTALLDPCRAAPLWMDVTSLKAPAATALREAHPRVEAVGLHPMCSPPPTNSLDGRVLVVSENGVLARWGAWFAEFLVKIGGRQVHLGALQHDKLMSLVQAGCHAGWLAQAKLWSQIVPDLGGLEQLLAVRTPSFALLEKALSRILCGNPELYAAIQLSNPEVPATLRMLADGMSELADLVAAGDREGLIKQFFEIPRETLGRKQLQDGNADFERLANLLADLDRPHPLVITVVKNAPGTLTNVLAEFATNGINLQSIQSIIANDGQLRFHICLDRPSSNAEVQAVGRELTRKGLIRLWDSSLR